jgi:hypothetical protein
MRLNVQLWAKSRRHDLSFFILIVLCRPFIGALAQSVEQLAFNQLVVRSSRTRPTNLLFLLVQLRGCTDCR